MSRAFGPGPIPPFWCDVRYGAYPLVRTGDPTDEGTDFGEKM
jgi:hypothetical protein